MYLGSTTSERSNLTRRSLAMLPDPTTAAGTFIGIPLSFWTR